MQIDEVKKTERVGLAHLYHEKYGMSPLEFIDIVNWVEEQADQKIGPANSVFSEKADGIGLRFGLDENDRFFLESSRSGPQFDKGSFGKFAIGKSGKTNKISDAYDDIHATLFDDKVLNAILKKYNTNGVKVVGEGFYLPNGVDHDDDKDLVKFIATYYRKDKLGSWATFVLFDVLDGNGSKHPDADKIIKAIKTLSNKKVTYEDSSTDVNDSVDFKAEIKELRTLIASIEKKEARTINDILTDKSRKRDATTKRKEIKAEVLKIQKLFADKLGKLIKGKWGPQLEGLVVQLANGTAFKVISDTFKEQKKDFKSIFKQMRESVISEATWYDSKYIGKLLKVKPMDSNVKVAGSYKDIAGRIFKRIKETEIPTGIEAIQIGSHPNTKKYRLGETEDLKIGYFQSTDTNEYYVFIGVPANIINPYEVDNGTIKLSPTVKTAYQESSVCHLLALLTHKKFNNASDLYSYIIEEDLQEVINTIKSVSDRYETTFPVENTIEFLRQEPSWADSNTRIASSMFNRFNLSGSYKFHRGSTFTEALDSLGYQLAKKEDKSINNKDKWNPSDIWITKNSFNANDYINSKNISELNENLRNGSNEQKIKSILGVSLKAVGKKLTYEFTNFETVFVSHEIDNVEFAPDYFSRGVRTKDKNGNLEINWRTKAGNTYRTSLTASISGKYAQGGGISTSIFFKHLGIKQPSFPTKDNFYIDKNTGVPTQKSYELVRKYVSLANDNIKRLKIRKLVGEVLKIDSYEDFIKLTDATLKKNKDGIHETAISIYYALISLSIISDLTVESYNYIYKFAASKTPVSGPFVKIS